MTATPDQLIVALDGIDPLRALQLTIDLRSLGITTFKVSAENLMWPDADDLFKYLQLNGLHSMFDLKVWDTPDTVARIVDRVVGRYNPSFVTVHPSPAVVHAALKAAAHAGALPGTITPVAYLSSDPDPDTVVPGYEAVGRAAAGVVPAYGVSEYASVFPDAWLISPGVRLDGSNDNHVRAVGPREALKSGATSIVVGRPIVNAERPLSAAERYLKEMSL